MEDDCKKGHIRTTNTKNFHFRLLAQILRVEGSALLFFKEKYSISTLAKFLLRCKATFVYGMNIILAIFKIFLQNSKYGYSVEACILLLSKYFILNGRFRGKKLQDCIFGFDRNHKFFFLGEDTIVTLFSHHRTTDTCCYGGK